MGEVRAFSPHVYWTDSELVILRSVFPTKPWQEVLAAFPDRNDKSIFTKGKSLGLARPGKTARTAAEVLKAKRESMARRRAADPEGARVYQMARYRADIDNNRAKLRAYQQRRFFWLKAQRLKKPGRATYREIAAMWKAQRGRCALTGVKLDRTAELDHKHPRSRGGGDEPANLQWLSYEANRAKGILTMDEFRALCRLVVAHG